MRSAGGGRTGLNAEATGAGEVDVAEVTVEASKVKVKASKVKVTEVAEVHIAEATAAEVLARAAREANAATRVEWVIDQTAGVRLWIKPVISATRWGTSARDAMLVGIETFVK